MRMRIRNVTTYGLHHIARLIIEHPREWLASLADYIYHAKSRLNTPVRGSLRSPNYQTSLQVIIYYMT